MSHQRSYSMLGPTRLLPSWVTISRWVNYLGMSTQVDSAFYALWDDKISFSFQAEL